MSEKKKKKEERRKKKNKIEIIVIDFVDCEEKQRNSGAFFYLAIAKAFICKSFVCLCCVYVGAAPIP